MNIRILTLGIAAGCMLNNICAAKRIEVVQGESRRFQAPGKPVSYYLDADSGSDRNAGTSPVEAWASLARASAATFQPGDQILLRCGDRFKGSLVFNDENGTADRPIVIRSYGSGNRPVIDAAGYQAAIHIISCDHIEVRDMEITGDGGAHMDGSNGSKRYGVFITNTSGHDADGITVRNVRFHTIYPYKDTPSEGVNPTTYMGTAIQAVGSSGNPSEGLLVENCQFENLGYKVLHLDRQNKARILNNLMKNIGGPAMVPNRCNDLLVQGNTVDGSGQYTDPRMHGRGSGIWPINCKRVMIQKNAFMHARGRYDSCGVHIDHDNHDVVVQYNLSMDNEGGFVEILGGNRNCAYRYNISINDGARTKGVRGASGDGHTIEVTGHNNPERIGPFNSYIYNNTIYVNKDILSRLRVDRHTDGLLVANNIFYVEGPAENGTPDWLRKYKPGFADRIVWTNNLYQRAGIFPKDFPFADDAPVCGIPNLAKPGGLAAADYIPRDGALIKDRGIAIPSIPGDPLGLRIGLAVREDWFGNPIEGRPDMGAVEIGGGSGHPAERPKSRGGAGKEQKTHVR